MGIELGKLTEKYEHHRKVFEQHGRHQGKLWRSVSADQHLKTFFQASDPFLPWYQLFEDLQCTLPSTSAGQSTCSHLFNSPEVIFISQGCWIHCATLALAQVDGNSTPECSDYKVITGPWWYWFFRLGWTGEMSRSNTQLPLRYHPVQPSRRYQLVAATPANNACHHHHPMFRNGTGWKIECTIMYPVDIQQSAINLSSGL